MNIHGQAKRLYRSFARSFGGHELRKPAVLVVIFVFAVFLSSLVWSPFPVKGQTATATPTAPAAPVNAATSAALTAQSPVLPSPTPFPAEITSNSQQTTVITFAGTVLVLIILVGVIAFLPKELDHGRHS